MELLETACSGGGPSSRSIRESLGRAWEGACPRLDALARVRPARKAIGLGRHSSVVPRIHDWADLDSGHLPTRGRPEDTHLRFEEISRPGGWPRRPTLHAVGSAPGAWNRY